MRETKPSRIPHDQGRGVNIAMKTRFMKYSAAASSAVAASISASSRTISLLARTQARGRREDRNGHVHRALDLSPEAAYCLPGMRLRVVVLGLAVSVGAAACSNQTSPPADQVRAACDAQYGAGSDQALECGAVAYCAMQNPHGARLAARGVKASQLTGDALFDWISYTACADPPSLEELSALCESYGFTDCPNPNDYGP
jgi:hypothetical protein